MKISVLACNAALNAFTALIDVGGAGSIRILTGTAPTNTTDADTGTLLTTNTFSATSFGASSGGTATAAAIANSVIAASGEAGYFRIYSGGGLCIWQGTIATSGADINMTTTTFTAGQTFAISSMTLTHPAS